MSKALVVYRRKRREVGIDPLASYSLSPAIQMVNPRSGEVPNLTANQHRRGGRNLIVKHKGWFTNVLRYSVGLD